MTANEAFALMVGWLDGEPGSGLALADAMEEHGYPWQAGVIRQAPPRAARVLAEALASALFVPAFNGRRAARLFGELALLAGTVCQPEALVLSWPEMGEIERIADPEDDVLGPLAAYRAAVDDAL